jgi:riboflavin synthase
MFTGLIESVGRVVALDPLPGGVRVWVETALEEALGRGDSLAHDGVCLTVVEKAEGRVAVDVSPETLRVTALGTWRPGSQVNLERPLRADSRLGGHFVLGHVDATGIVRRIVRDGEFHWLSVSYPTSLASLVIAKGSVAIDGISLTIATLRHDEFDVQIVPFTWQHTGLHAKLAGDLVNLEADVLGKYVARLADLRVALPGPAASGVARD